MKKIFAFFALLLWLNTSIFAQAAMPEFKPDVKRVAIFKNGYVFTYREGKTPMLNGWAYTTNAPTGVIGAVWGYTMTPNARVVQMLASEAEKKEAARVVNLTEVLQANQGAQVRVKTKINNNSNILQGTYEFLGGDGDNPTIALKTETGTLFLPFALIETIEIVGQPKLEKMVSKNENRLAIKTDGAIDGQNIDLGIAALERGIRWIPAYRIEVKGEPAKEAKIELEAMLINDLTDLNNTEVNFVVGVPNFLFQETISPLSLNKAFAGVSTYFDNGTRGERRNAYSNAIMTQAAGSNENTSNAAFDSVTSTISSEEQTASFSADQLYLYQTKQISIKKGERASLRLFSLTVPCSEIFEWTLNDDSQTSSRYMTTTSYSSEQSLATVNLTDKIWYGLKLKNTTGMPWTTAPALSFRDWKPLGQDMMTFTPIGSENILRVTPATEVLGTHTVEEKSRVREQLRYQGGTYDFDLVTIEGLIKLRNIKKQPVDIIIRRNLVGETISATDAGKINREGLNLQAVNPNSKIVWNLTLPTGEKEIRYSYKVYVRK